MLENEVEIGDERLVSVRNCLDIIESSIGSAENQASLAESHCLRKARSQLLKISAESQYRNRRSSKHRESEDNEFSDFFLDTFTTNSMLKEMDELRRAEGDQMTEGDLGTLAESIRNFGIELSHEERELFRESLN
jgi:hypothetical protein